MKITFEAKAGWFGEKGWKEVRFWHWLKLWFSNVIVRIIIDNDIEPRDELGESK